MTINHPISALLREKTTTLWSVRSDTMVFDAIKLMSEKNIGAILVLEGEKLLGIFTERDYTRKIALLGKSSRETRISDAMSRAPITVTLEHSVEDCMRLMSENRMRHLPVLQGQNVAGIISIGDLVNWIISSQSATISQMEQYISGSMHT